MARISSINWVRDRDGDYRAYAYGLQFHIMRATVPRLSFALNVRRGDEYVKDSGPCSWTTLGWCKKQAEQVLVEQMFAVKAA